MGLSGKVLRILIISDLERDRPLILNQLRMVDCSFYVERVTTEAEFRSNIDNLWSLVIYMSHVTFLDPQQVLQGLKVTHPNLPLVVISDGMGEEEVANLIKAGAEDVVITSRFQRFITVVKRVESENSIKLLELEASKLALQGIAAREQMLAIVSHDIRNPLSAIQIEAEMLLRVAERNGKTLVSEQISLQAHRILRTTDRLKNLITDLLDRNKTEDSLSTLNQSEADLSLLFQEAFEANQPLLKQKNILVKTAFPTNIRLEIDKSKIFQAMNNLLGNAIKFTPKMGIIRLAIEELGREYVFSVSDSGPGLREHELKKVFEKYWTAGASERSGTGLGLFICKTIIAAHGGEIGGENLSGGGAKFWFSLPKPHRSQEVGLFRDKKPKILLIDDDEDLREVISWALNQEGYSVHSYADPKVALESLRLGRHLPQLIVIDFQMDQMKGTEFLKRMNEQHHPHAKSCPVVMISASPEEIDKEEARELCREVMSKPLDLGTLIGNVNRYFEKDREP